MESTSSHSRSLFQLTRVCARSATYCLNTLIHHLQQHAQLSREHVIFYTSVPDDHFPTYIHVFNVLWPADPVRSVFKYVPAALLIYAVSFK